MTYTRWGRTSCRSVSGTLLVYSGKVGGTKHNKKGGAANYLCMPNNPEYTSHTSQIHLGNFIYGGEFSMNTGHPLYASKQNHDVPCAVCYASTRGSLLMIPAKLSCPNGWTEEYDGYLMSEFPRNTGRTMYICIDRSPESYPGENDHDPDRVELFMVEAVCNGGFSCPPYSQNKEITCVVCTR